MSLLSQWIRSNQRQIATAVTAALAACVDPRLADLDRRVTALEAAAVAAPVRRPRKPPATAPEA